MNSLRSRLTLGEDYTPSDIFDSVPFRGVMLGSDESMRCLITSVNLRRWSEVLPDPGQD
ncbi:fimbria/pilus outer membrane usher protein [Escherichia coli]